MPLSVGIANCSFCGTTVGTLFSETNAQPVNLKGKQRTKYSAKASTFDRVETAKERANQAVILALSGFFPFIGFFMGVAAIVLGALASKTLRAENIEDGRGSATAGLIIGVLALIAQGGYVVYVVRSGNLPFAG